MRAEEAPVDAADVVARHVGAVLGEVDGAAEVGRAVQAAQEALHHRAREQLEVADPGQDLRVEEAAAAASLRAGRSGMASSYIPDRGAGHGGQQLLDDASSCVTRSDSAWKLVRMRCRNTG